MGSIKHRLRKQFPRLWRFYEYLRVRRKARGKLIFDRSCRIDSSSTFEGANRILPNCRFSGSMGYGSYIMQNSNVEAHIGRFTSIAPNLQINKGMHPFTAPYVSSCPMFYSTLKQNGYTFAKRNTFVETRPYTKIGNDVWIGQNVFMTGGLTIGDGAVILAGAVVTKNIPPYAIAGGVPCVIKGYRYDEATIAVLLEMKWWNQPLGWLMEHWELMNDIGQLLSYYHNHSGEFNKQY